MQCPGAMVTPSAARHPLGRHTDRRARVRCRPLDERCRSSAAVSRQLPHGTSVLRREPASCRPAPEFCRKDQRPTTPPRRLSVPVGDLAVANRSIATRLRATFDDTRFTTTTRWRSARRGEHRSHTLLYINGNRKFLYRGIDQRISASRSLAGAACERPAMRNGLPGPWNAPLTTRTGRTVVSGGRRIESRPSRMRSR